MRLTALTVVATLGMGAQPAAAGDARADYMGPPGNHPAILYWCDFTDALCGESGHRGDAIQLPWGMLPSGLRPSGASEAPGAPAFSWAMVNVRDDRCRINPLFFIEFGRPMTFRFKCL